MHYANSKIINQTWSCLLSFFFVINNIIIKAADYKSWTQKLNCVSVSSDYPQLQWVDSTMVAADIVWYGTQFADNLFVNSAVKWQRAILTVMKFWKMFWKLVNYFNMKSDSWLFDIPVKTKLITKTETNIVFRETLRSQWIFIITGNLVVFDFYAWLAQRKTFYSSSYGTLWIEVSEKQLDRTAWQAIQYSPPALLTARCPRPRWRRRVWRAVHSPPAGAGRRWPGGGGGEPEGWGISGTGDQG